MTTARLGLVMTTSEYRKDPVAFARELLGFMPDPNQATLLGAAQQYVMVNCHRQWGNTTMTAMRAVHRAVSKPAQQIVVVSASLRQSMALANRCREFAHQLHLTLRTEAANKGSMVFPNGSVMAPEFGRCQRIATAFLDLRLIS